MVKSEELALVRGMADTKQTLRRWQRGPLAAVGPWAGLSLLTAIGLLSATWLVATLSQPDPSGFALVGINHAATAGDYVHVLIRNSLVLALHALACVAGFIAGSSLPTVAEGHSGLWRKVHDVAGPLAIGFVACATLFSLTTQAYVLGTDASTIANQLGLSPAQLIGVLSLHAIPELTALFLPLAAWTVASRRGRWNELLAATFVTVAIAVPVILAAAAVETWVTPQLLMALSG
jgi:hypothetical protein